MMRYSEGDQLPNQIYSMPMMELCVSVCVFFLLILTKPTIEATIILFIVEL